MSKSGKNISIVSHEIIPFDTVQKLSITIGLLGLFVLTLALFNVTFPNKGWWLAGSIVAILSGIILFANKTYLNDPEGIKNNGVWHKSLTNTGSWAWMIGIILTSFYIVLYWYPQYLGLNQTGGKNTGIVGFFDPLSTLLNGKAASQWFVYGTLYTVAI